MNHSLKVYIHLLILVLIVLPLSLHAAEKFYNYYENGSNYMKAGDWQRAIIEFKSAVSLEFEDAARKRTYGTRFIKYYPHREMGIAYYNLNQPEEAQAELKLSLAYKNSKQAQIYLDQLNNNNPNLKSYPIENPKTTIVNEPKRQSKKKKIIPDIVTPIAVITTKKLPPGALTYDPGQVTQVGSRLAIAVMPFTPNSQAKEYQQTVTDKMITQLVNLKRFRVIERGAIEAVMKEQKFSLSGLVNEDSAIQLGKIVGADVIIMGNLSIEAGFSRFSARVIDVETSVNIVAKESSTNRSGIKHIEKLVEDVAVMIYNDLPLVEGSIISLEDDLIYLDIGSEVGIKKGTKCVIFKEGNEIIHPKTKQVLGKKVSKIGELIVVQVQGKMATARLVSEEGKMNIGDKVVVK